MSYRDREDPLGVSRGIVLGLVMGSLMWGLIIGGFIYILKMF